MFEESLEIIKNCFIEYKGTGSYMTLYCLAVLYLFLKEKDKTKRAFTIYFPIFVLLLVMNPIFNKAVGSILKKGAYWRVFWLVPMGVTIAYASAKLIMSLERISQKIIVSICFMGIIALGGKYMYTEGNFLPVGNPYKIQDDMVYVAQIIGADEAEYKKALVSHYLAPYIRQIDGSIELAYPRSATPYTPESIAAKIMRGEVNEVVAYAQKNNANYIVFHKETELLGDVEEYGYKLLQETQDYRIYKLIDEEEN